MPSEGKAKVAVSTTEVICSYAPSQSAVVSHLAATAGGSAIAATSVAQAASLTAVLHSSGAYIFTGARAGTLPALSGLLQRSLRLSPLGVLVGGSAATLELVCAAKNHPELASKVETAAKDLMTRSRASLASTSAQTVAVLQPFVADAKSVVTRTSADAFEYADRITVQLSQAFQGKSN